MSIAQATGILSKLGALDLDVMFTSRPIAFVLEAITRRESSLHSNLGYAPDNGSNRGLDTCSSSSDSVASIAWVVTMIIELILFALVVAKARLTESSRLSSSLSKSRCNLTSVIAKDSRVYFGMYDPYFLSSLSSFDFP